MGLKDSNHAVMSKRGPRFAPRRSTCCPAGTEEPSRLANSTRSFTTSIVHVVGSGPLSVSHAECGRCRPAEPRVRGGGVDCEEPHRGGDARNVERVAALVASASSVRAVCVISPPSKVVGSGPVAVTSWAGR